MSELRAWGRRDRGDHAPDAPDMPARDANDAPRLPTPIRDAETRIREALEYRKRVEVVYAVKASEAGDAPKAGRASEAGHAPERQPVEGPDRYPNVEKPDRPASGIARRRDSPDSQKEERDCREHRRLPSNETAQFAVSLGVVATTVADVLNIMPAKLDAVAASLLGAVVAGVAWGNKRWKDKHADRPED